MAVERLTPWKKAAEALRGRLSERASKPGGAKAATEAEHEAAAAQGKALGDHHRVLAQAAAIDTRIESLLKAAARSRGGAPGDCPAGVLTSAARRGRRR